MFYRARRRGASRPLFACPGKRCPVGRLFVWLKDAPEHRMLALSALCLLDMRIEHMARGLGTVMNGTLACSVRWDDRRGGARRSGVADRNAVPEMGFCRGTTWEVSNAEGGALFGNPVSAGYQRRGSA